jgi:hypothetical protein
LPRYVYGVVRSETPVPSEDRGLGAVDVVEDDGLAAVCSTVSDEPLGRRRELRAHADVLADLAHDHAVVPFVFGTVLPDDDAVRAEVLQRRGPQLLGELDRLADVVQMAVRLVPDEDLLIADVMASSPDLRQLEERSQRVSPGRAQSARLELGQAVADRYRDWVRRLSAAALDSLAEHAVDVRVEGADADAATKADLLVRRADISGFLAAAGSTADAMRGRLRCRVTGPMAPFSFVVGETAPGRTMSGAR